MNRRIRGRRSVAKRMTLATTSTSSATGSEPTMLISSVALDRDGDVVVPEGGDFAAYQRNPVVGWQHFRSDPLPIGTTTSLSVEAGKGIRASWRWLEGDALADRVRNAFSQGVLRAASISFLPREWEPIESGGVRFTSWELTEWSLCAVPSNRDAVRTLRSLGLWEDDDDRVVLELLDDPVVLHIIDDDEVVLELIP